MKIDYLLLSYYSFGDECFHMKYLLSLTRPEEKPHYLRKFCEFFIQGKLLVVYTLHISLTMEELLPEKQRGALTAFIVSSYVYFG
jgi:hypothetical protein